MRETLFSFSRSPSYPHCHCHRLASSSPEVIAPYYRLLFNDYSRRSSHPCVWQRFIGGGTSSSISPTWCCTSCLSFLLVVALPLILRCRSRQASSTPPPSSLLLTPLLCLSFLLIVAFLLSPSFIADKSPFSLNLPSQLLLLLDNPIRSVLNLVIMLIINNN